MRSEYRPLSKFGFCYFSFSCCIAGNKGPTVSYEVSFAMLGSSVVSDLEVVVAASYTNESGENIKVNLLCLLTHFSPRFQGV